MAEHATALLDDGHSQRLVGRWDRAIELYESVVRSAVKQRDVCSFLEAVLAVGHSYRESGELEAAVEQYELTIALADLHRDPGRASRALNGLGIISQSRGEVEQAALQYEQARLLAETVGDVLGLGNIHQNLGTLANIRGRTRDALKYYQLAQQCFEKTGHNRGLAGVLNNLGMLHVDTGQYRDADRCLRQALTICKRSGDLLTESIVHANRTELYIAIDNPELARSSCDEAFELSCSLSDSRIKADSLKYYGIIYRNSHKLHLAESHLQQAIFIAQASDNPLTEAEARRELALVFRASERNREALESLYQAYTLFSRLNAVHEQAEIDSHVSGIEGDFLSVVAAWGESIEAKDQYTRGHCQRVANYACRIAEEVGLEQRELVWFRMGAFLHDVGKTSVPEELLNKVGELTAEERRVIERHTIAGDEILAPIPFPWDIRSMVRSHHERWDGRGYPDGLAADAIPLAARILSCADVFDALTTARSYRSPVTGDEALEIMRQDKGAFDPALFSILEDLLPDLSELLEASPPDPR